MTKEPTGDTDIHCSHNSPNLIMIRLQGRFLSSNGLQSYLLHLSVSCINYACRDSRPPRFQAGQASFFTLLQLCSRAALRRCTFQGLAFILQPFSAHFVDTCTEVWTPKHSQTATHRPCSLLYTINGRFAASNHVLITRHAQTQQSNPAMNKYSWAPTEPASHSQK